jgi:hypothetical protein
MECFPGMPGFSAGIGTIGAYRKSYVYSVIGNRINEEVFMG